MTGTTPTNFAYGALLLRVCLGIMYLAHSVILKWMTFTLGGTAHYFKSIGLPGSLAYATFFAEMIGGIFLIAGVQTRWVALALMPILIGALGVHSGNGWVFTAQGGGWEYPLYLIALSVGQALFRRWGLCLKSVAQSVGIDCCGVSNPADSLSRMEASRGDLFSHQLSPLSVCAARSYRVDGKGLSFRWNSISNFPKNLIGSGRFRLWVKYRF